MNINKKSNITSKNRLNSRNEMLVGTAILTAIVFVLQLAAFSVKLGISTFCITPVLMPIVVGAALYGWKSGAWLGFAFGLAVLVSGDASIYMAINAPGTIFTVLLKGMAAGVCAGLVYKSFERKNQWLAIILAAIVCPVVNTGIFLLGSVVFFFDTVREWAGTESVAMYMITGLVGFNFVIELAINLVLSTAIERILNAVRKRVFI